MTVRTDSDVRPDTQRAVQQGLLEINEFVQSDGFRRIFAELWSLPEEDRAQFVLDVILDPDALSARDVIVPSGLVMQRSTFRDNRPTLFCVVKHLEPGLLWEKVTVTIDNPSGLPALMYDDVVPKSQEAS